MELLIPNCARLGVDPVLEPCLRALSARDGRVSISSHDVPSIINQSSPSSSVVLHLIPSLPFQTFSVHHTRPWVKLANPYGVGNFLHSINCPVLSLNLLFHGSQSQSQLSTAWYGTLQVLACNTQTDLYPTYLTDFAKR